MIDYIEDGGWLVRGTPDLTEDEARRALFDRDQMTFTATFTFPPDVGGWYGPPPDRPVTYLEETPEGDIVERIDDVVRGWERIFPWGDAMRWTGEEEPEPEAETHEGDS